MKILVVDDSALMRKYLRQMLEKEDDIDVITARDGEDALEKAKREKPDVITLDINMPVMDGLTCLAHLMKDCPIPTIMLSSLTEKGATATFEALELGAVDFIAKPDGTVSRNIGLIETQILAKVRSAAGMRMGKSGGVRQRMRARREQASVAQQILPIRAKGKIKIVLVGVSTGGPRALEAWLPKLPADFPVPIVIAQHMPGSFTAVFADRINGLCQCEVVESGNSIELKPGLAVIARGGADVLLRKKGSKTVAASVPISAHHIWHPSVSRLVSSAAEVYRPEEIICVQLTGMGDDGAKEMAEIHKKGARSIAESEESASIFGMPACLIALNGAEVVLPACAVARQLKQWV